MSPQKPHSKCLVELKALQYSANGSQVTMDGERGNYKNRWFPRKMPTDLTIPDSIHCFVEIVSTDRISGRVQREVCFLVKHGIFSSQANFSSRDNYSLL